MRFPEIKEMMGALCEFLSAEGVYYDTSSYEFVTVGFRYTVNPDGTEVLEEVDPIANYSFKQAYDIWAFVEENPNWDSIQGEWYDKHYGPSAADRHYLYIESEQSCPNYMVDEELPF